LNAETNTSRRFWSVRTPNDILPAACFFPMTRNNENTEQSPGNERKREAAKWLAGLTQIVAQDGTQRVLEGNEAVEAIIRQWEADDAG
jgi:hypothetical protein